MLRKCTLESVCRAWSFLGEPLGHSGPLQCGGAFNYAWLGCVREAMHQPIAQGRETPLQCLTSSLELLGGLPHLHRRTPLALGHVAVLAETAAGILWTSQPGFQLSVGRATVVPGGQLQGEIASAMPSGPAARGARFSPR